MALQAELESILSGTPSATAIRASRFSARGPAGFQRTSLKSADISEAGPKRRRRRMSPAAKAKLAAVARARWARVKARGGNAL